THRRAAGAGERAHRAGRRAAGQQPDHLPCRGDRRPEGRGRRTLDLLRASLNGDARAMQPTLTMKTPSAANADPRPWYRHRWPWLLAIAPVAALVGGIVMLWLAVTTSDSLVVDDYYREGRAINQQLARDRLAAALGLRAELRFEALAEPAVVLQLAAERGSAWPPELRLRIVHSTIASHDREYRLEHVGDGRYRAAAV